MKRWMLFLCVLFALEIEAATICLNMIVKNESRVIERCLASVKGFVDYWVIVDTGSTDGTQEVIRAFMQDMPGELHERPWIDFAHNRNEALELAKNKADYTLFIDADERLIFPELFTKPVLDRDFYFIFSETHGCRYARIQLVKSALNWEWRGVLHELVESTEAKTYSVLNGVINQISWDGARSNDPKKHEKDAEVLERDLKKNPTNVRNLFYLARTYQALGKDELALKNFEKRALDKSGDDEEVFLALCTIPRLQERLKMPFDVVVASYSKAYQYRPLRAEALYYLANYYFNNQNYLFAYEACKFALSLPHPNNLIHVEEWIYDHGLIMKLADSAAALGKHEEARELKEKIKR